jgi:hypothetical protein
MTIVDQRPPFASEIIVDPASTLAFDAYRDIHKGIRAELFAVTASAGNTDPGDREGRAVLSAHVVEVIALLADHAHHEDTHLLPVLEEHLPVLFERNATEHTALETRLNRIADRAGAITDAEAGEQRARVHNLYLDLASFTGAYLAHQEFEERMVMPAVLDAIGVDGAFAVHTAIVSSIPPPTMAKGLAVMVPALNVEDRMELLSGIQHGAPPETFAAVWSLTRSVLSAADFRALAARMGRS